MRVAFHGMTGRQRLIPMLVRYLVIDYKNRKSCDGLQSLAFLDSTGRCSYLVGELNLSYPSIPRSVDIFYMIASTLNTLPPYGLAEL
jgi:hypothetical protein